MKERNNHPKNLDEGQKQSFSNKTKTFLKNTTKAVRDTIAATGIAVSTLIPASVESLTTIAPTAAKVVAVPTAAALVTACHDDLDTTAPKIDIVQNQIEIQGGESLRISGNQIYVGNTLMFRCSDDVSTNLNISVTFNGKPISSGYTFNESGTLSIKASDEAGNLSSPASTKIDILNNAPTIDLKQSEVNIFGGVKVTIKSNQLLLGDELIAEWKDDKTQNCKVSFKVDGEEIKSGETLDKSGQGILSVTDENGNTSSEKISISNEAISGLESLNTLNMQVDNEVDLLRGITLANGVELIKVEIETDGQRHEITDPHHYSPEYPGTCNIIFTVKGKSGNTTEIKSGTLTINALEYHAIEISNIKPVDILPIIGQVESGDKKAYEHIEHLRIAEATRIRDMMWEYGTGKYSKEEYQALMSRLNTGMRGEIPLGYDNYELIGSTTITPDNHAHKEYHTLSTLVKHTNFKIVGSGNDSRQANLINFIKTHPNSINIFGSSSYSSGDDYAQYKKYILKDDIIYLCNLKNFIMFAAGTNIRHPGGVTKNKIYNGEYESDEHGIYSLASMANSDKNNYPNSHLLVTIATDPDGDIDQTNERYETSKYPVGFANGKNQIKNILFSGRTFPYHTINTDNNGGTTETIEAESGKYSTSHTNFVNVALTCLCFQMFAEIKDVDQLLEMIRLTALTDYIRFNGETQELQLINPAGFITKYLIPNNLPPSIKTGETIPLNKGYYKGIIFDIPGAEVKINGQWIEYNKANESLIKSQNPMNLQWRLNGDLVTKYSKNGSVTGKLIAVDDQWNGLNIENEINVNIN